MKKILLIPFVIFLNLWNSYAQVAPLLEYDWRLEKVIIDNEEILATQSVGSTEFEDWAHIYFYEENMFSFVWLHTSLTYEDENSSFVIHYFGGDFGSYHGAPSTDAFISDFLGEDGNHPQDVNFVFNYSFRYEEGLIYLDIVNEAGDVATFYTTTLSNASFEKVELSMYPNPATNIVHIQSSNAQILGVEIFNLQGISILKPEANQLTKIDVSPLAKGIYVVKVITTDGELVRKLVKK